MSNKSKNIFNLKLIEDFSNQYHREYDFYNAASAISAQLIDAKLISKGIRAIVTFRAKNPSRLHDKIKKRVLDKNYKKSDDIYKDIVDLSGVRIALYFNSERDEIDQIIKEIFDVQEKKIFPTEEKNQGYKAVHYRGCIKANVLTEQQQRYSKANVEIQVASLLMHAWAEVEHDIVYKPLQGKISEDEKKALDELNTIVLNGERALEKLQQAAFRRNSFNDHYDLYNFLIQYISEKYNIVEEKIFVGDTKKLYSYLLDNKIDTQLKLKNKIKELNIIIDEHWTLSDQIMDYIIGNYKSNSRSYLEYANKKGISSENAVGAFLLAWIELEKILKKSDMGTSYKDTFIRLKSLVNIELLSMEEYEKIYFIRNIRNNLVHGIEMPENDYLEWHTKEIKRLTEDLKNKKAERAYG